MEGMVKQRLNMYYLNMYYLIDTSASMYGERIEKLNTCMQNLKPVLEETAIDKNVDIVVRVLEFGNDVHWSIGSYNEGVKIEDFTWLNVSADGRWTPTAQAIHELSNGLNSEFLGKRYLRPVIILITDGECNDPEKDYSEACKMLAGMIHGNTTRIAVSVVDGDKSELEEFATVGVLGDKPDTPFVFRASNASDMIDIIHWATLVGSLSSLGEKKTDSDQIELSGAGLKSDWI